MKTANTETPIEFLDVLHLPDGKVMLVANNAPHHDPDMGKRHLESTDMDIRLLFLFQYTPRWNSAQIGWRAIKYKRGDRHFDTVGVE